MSGEVTVGFGGSSLERLQFAFDATDIQHSDPAPEDWLAARVTVLVSSFRGAAKVSIWRGDFERLLPELRLLYDSLRGTATFSTLERQVGFTITGDGMGHMTLEGFLRDRAGGDNRLMFTIIFDQTLLLQSISEIEALYAVTPET